MKPTQRCSSTASRTCPEVNSTTSGPPPWQLQAEATSAQRSRWNLLEKVGPPGQLLVDEKGNRISVKVMKQAILKDAHEVATWSPMGRSLLLLPLLLALSACSLIDWQPRYWLSSGYVARNAVVNYVVMNRAYPVKWPLGREVAGENQ